MPPGTSNTAITGSGLQYTCSRLHSDQVWTTHCHLHDTKSSHYKSLLIVLWWQRLRSKNFDEHVLLLFGNQRNNYGELFWLPPVWKGLEATLWSRNNVLFYFAFFFFFGRSKLGQESDTLPQASPLLLCHCVFCVHFVFFVELMGNDWSIYKMVLCKSHQCITWFSADIKGDTAKTTFFP